MAVLINDRETDRLIRELAQRTGQSITDAVRQSVQERLAGLDRKPGRVDRVRLVSLLAEAAAGSRGDDSRSDDEIVGYNDQGHFG